jgi:hypothetical protein
MAFSFGALLEPVGTYAGVGSRSTPEDVLELMGDLAARLAGSGWRLRSGRARGADDAFERGAERVQGDVEVYRPDGGWCGLEELTPGGPTEAALALAKELHPAWGRCSEYVRRLHGRNGHQVLGPALDDPVRFLCCWTPDGSLDGSRREAGGTGQALRVAVRFGVPVVNLARPGHRRSVESFLARRS